MYIVKGIHWDVDTDKDGKRLPVNVTILDKDILEYVFKKLTSFVDDDDVVEYLTDKYEFCIQGIDSIERI